MPPSLPRSITHLHALHAPPYCRTLPHATPKACYAGACTHPAAAAPRLAWRARFAQISGIMAAKPASGVDIHERHRRAIWRRWRQASDGEIWQRQRLKSKRTRMSEKAASAAKIKSKKRQSSAKTMAAMAPRWRRRSAWAAASGSKMARQAQNSNNNGTRQHGRQQRRRMAARRAMVSAAKQRHIGSGISMAAAASKNGNQHQGVSTT